METPSKTPEAAVGARTDSANSDPSTSETKDKAKTKRKMGASHDPTKRLKRSDKLLTRVSATHDERCKRDAAPVPGQESRLRAASAKLTLAVQREVKAEEACTPFAAEVATRLLPIIALLRLSAGGKQVLDRVGGRDPVAKARSVLERLPPGFEGVPSKLVADLKASLNALQPAVEELAAAKAGQRAAAEVYKSADLELGAQLGMLWTSLTRFRIAQRLVKKAA